MPVNVTELLKRATSIQKITAGNTAGGTSTMSLNVVYSRNGKRLTISKKLAEALNLSDEAQISFVEEDGVVILAKHISDNEDERIILKLKNEMDNIKGIATGKKISYNADAAYGIVNAFNLDYTNCSSKSFTKIEIDRSSPDNPLAIITIKEV